jgi:hypothetical protein
MWWFVVLGGLLREHGHKTPLNWILTGVFVVLVVGWRIIRAARSRSQK